LAIDTTAVRHPVVAALAQVADAADEAADAADVVAS